MVRRYWAKPNACFGSSECIFAGPLGPSAFTIIVTGRTLAFVLSCDSNGRLTVADSAPIASPCADPPAIRPRDGYVRQPSLYAVGNVRALACKQRKVICACC